MRKNVQTETRKDVLAGIRLFNLALIVSLAMMAVSCMKEPEQHLLAVVHPTNGLLYADQTDDSLVFITHDSYVINPVESWVHLTGENNSHDFNYNSYRRYSIHMPITFDENTTGKSRVGTVRITSYEYTAYGFWVQLGHLNIQHPAGKAESYIGNMSSVPEKMLFAIADSAFVTEDSICFNVRKDWSLRFAEGADETWVSFDEYSGSAGRHKVVLRLEENETYEDRRTKVVLTSGTVSNEVSILQYAKKKSEDE